MNCANHPDIPSAAFCRSCGKALCANCARDVKGVIYCESCIADRLQGIHPPQGAFAPGVVPGTAQRLPGSGPNPGLAGTLAGFFPFGVGAVYTGQYAKGLAHLVIFVLLIIGMNQGDPLDTICGLVFAFFYVYQIIDAVRSARAIQAGLTPPDPFGLAQAFGASPAPSTAQPVVGQAIPAIPVPVRESRVPTTAVVLIGLGVLFLLQTAGVFYFSVGHLWPLFLIALGAWLLVKRLGVVGSGHDRYGRAYGRRGITVPAALMTLGVLFFLEQFDNGPGFHRTWPILLLVIGIGMLLERSGTPPLPPSMPMPPSVPPPSTPGPVVPPPSSEVHNG